MDEGTTDIRCVYTYLKWLFYPGVLVNPKLTNAAMIATTTRAPVRLATKSSALRQALYSWLVVSISSPGENLSDLNTELTPVVALGTNTKS